MSNSPNDSASQGAVVRDHQQPVSDLAIEGRQDFVVEDDVVRLIASSSQSSGSLAFPQRRTCQVTGARDMAPVTVGPNGVLYSFSTVHVSSTRQTPYTLGYIDFENGLRVLAEIRAARPGTLTCDMAVTLAADATGWWAEPIRDGRVA